jgi:hypothetical protein
MWNSKNSEFLGYVITPDSMEIATVRIEGIKE